MPSPMDETLDAIFGIPKDGSNIKDDDDSQDSYADAVKPSSNEPFELKASKLNETLAKDAPKTDVSYIQKEPTNVSQKEQPKPEQKEQPKEVAPKKDAFEAILAQSILGGEPSTSKVSPMVQEPPANHEDSKPTEDAHEEIEVATPPYKGPANEDGWTLTPPSPMFKYFYGEKLSFITNLTKGSKPINFDKLMEELRTSRVSVATELTDLQGMSNKMDKIQEYLDRVVEIKILATAQCAACKRGVELLRGVLAKVIYEKPAARQDGVIHDHMKDIEMYACNVEALEQAAKDVYHNLLEAKEILSRKAGIAFELLKQQNVSDSIERNYKTLPDDAKKRLAQSAINPSVSEKLAGEGFDSLETQEVVKGSTPVAKQPTIKGPGKTGMGSWMD